MPRPREFDEDEVLGAALETFWSRGYEATSITDLMEATGLAKGSLYKAFGDKRSLFLRALERYLEQSLQRLGQVLGGADGARDGLETWMRGVLDGACGRDRKGCFVVNCIVELAPHDPEVRDRLRAHVGSMEASYARAIAQGVETGELRADLEPRIAAQLVSTVLNGIQVSGKSQLSRRDGEALVSLAVSSLL